MYLYGDKFAADGYLMPKSLLSSAKREQLLNVFDEISQKSLPLRINKPLKLAPMVNCYKSGNMIIMLTNMSFDDTGYFECEIRNKGQFYRIGKDGSLNELKQERIGENTVIQIDNIEKFEYLLLTNIKKQ